MTDAAFSARNDLTRPPDDSPAAALPLEPRDGVATIGIADPRRDAPRLLHGSLASTIAVVALPAVASMLLMTLFSSADAYWVGRKIGATGLAAVSTAVFWIWMILSGAELIGVGLTAVAARRHGEGRHEQAALDVGESMIFSLILGTAVAIVGSLSLPAMFRVMHTPADVTLLGERYLGMYLIGTPLIFGYFAVDAAFRASGNTRTPLMLLGLSVIGALALEPVLILGLGPVPRLGIAGAAVATILTRGVAFLAGVALLVRREMLRVGPITGRAITAVTRVGLPTALTGIVFSIIYVLLTRTTTHFGTPALAALGVGHRVESWTYTVGVGFGAAAAAIVGQNLGAGQTARAARAGWIATLFATAVAAVGALLEFTFAVPFASVFTADPAVIAESVRYLRIASGSTLFIGAELVLEGSLGGAGDTVPPMISSTALTVARVPIAIWAAVHWGTAGIWWTLSLTAAARGIAMCFLWRSGGWKRKSV